MAVKSRLQDGRLLLAGEVNERLPIITDGLLAHFPFDGVVNSTGHWTGHTYQSYKQVVDGLIKDRTITNLYLAQNVQIQFSAEFRKSSGYNTNVRFYNYHKLDGNWVYHGTDYFQSEINETWTLVKRTYTVPATAGVITNNAQGITVRETGTQGEWVEWRNATMQIIPSTNSNNTIMLDGLGVEKATTNLLTYPIGVLDRSGSYYPAGTYQPGWDVNLHDDYVRNSGWSTGWNAGVPSPTIGFHAKWVEHEGMDGNVCSKQIDENWKFGLGHRWLGHSIQISSNRTTFGWTDGTVVTLSWYQKVSHIGKQGGVGIYHKENTVSSFYDTITYPTNSKVGVWERHTHTFTVDSDWDVDSFVAIYMYGHYGDYGTIWYDKVQVEVNSFPTSYVVGSRSATGGFKVAIPGSGLTTCTIFGKFLPRTAWKYETSAYYHTENQASLIHIKDVVNTGNMYFRYYESGTTSSPFLDADGCFGTTHTHNTSYDIEADDWIYFAMRFDGTYCKIKLWQGGNWKAEHIDTIDGTYEINELYFGDSTLWNGVYKDVSIYNRALSDTELNQLIGVKQQLTSDYLLVKELSEGIFFKNSFDNSMNFPLANDLRNTAGHRYFIVNDNNNEGRWEGRDLFIGNSTTNVETEPNFESGWSVANYNGSALSVALENDYVKLYDFIEAADYPRYVGPTLSPTVTGDVAVSLYMKGNIGDSIRIRFYEAGSTKVTVTFTIVKEGWNRFSETFNTAFTLDTAYINPLVISNTLYLKKLQVENKPFVTPFVDGTQSANHLEIAKEYITSDGAFGMWINFNESARAWRGVGNNNDYCMGWSIYSSGEANKLNLRSYYSWSANTWNFNCTNDVPSGSNIGNLTISDGWHHVMQCWDKTNSKHKVYIDGNLYQEITSANVPQTFDNVNFRVGNWDTGVWGALNMYVRDAVLLNFYPTDAQVKEIASRNFILSEELSIVSHEISEGENL